MLAGIPTLSAQSKKGEEGTEERSCQTADRIRKLQDRRQHCYAHARTVYTSDFINTHCKSEMIRYSLTSLITDVLTAFLTAEASGLNFNAPLKEYTMDMDKKGNAVIKFSARSPEDFFEFRAKVFPDGTTSIDVTMQNRQAISYRGEVDLDKK